MRSKENTSRINAPTKTVWAGSHLSVSVSVLHPLRPNPALLGEAKLRRKETAKAVGVRFPDPAQDTHLSHQLILPPLSTGPDQTLTREVLGFLLIIGVAHKIRSPLNNSSA
jgi:hypothetical protein